MGKTFCSKHERFYETACEYCVAPALPVIAVEAVCTCDGCRLGRAARAMKEAGHALTSTEIRALEAMRKPHEKPRNLAIDELFASPPMVHDAPYDPAKAPIGEPVEYEPYCPNCGGKASLGGHRPGCRPPRFGGLEIQVDPALGRDEIQFVPPIPSRDAACQCGAVMFRREMYVNVPMEHLSTGSGFIRHTPERCERRRRPDW